MPTRTRAPTRWGVGPLGTTLWSPSGICVWHKKGKCWLKALSDFFLLHSFPSNEETWSQETASKWLGHPERGLYCFRLLKKKCIGYVGRTENGDRREHGARSVFSQCQSVDQLLGEWGWVVLPYFISHSFSFLKESAKSYRADPRREREGHFLGICTHNRLTPSQRTP